jgi:uncharacterized MAPEG superfamily protein
MTIAMWMVVAGALLPYLTVLLAKAGTSYDNEMPRDASERLQGWRRRADWAHRNHFEAFPPFAAAVLLAEFTEAAQGRLDLLAIAFILLRIAYTAAYLAGAGTVRSMLWAASFGVTLWIFMLPV